MKDDLRQIGCSTFRATAQTTALVCPRRAFPPDQYQLGHDVCAYDSGRVFAEAGTQDPEEAATWYADGTVGSASKGAASML